MVVVAAVSAEPHVAAVVVVAWEWRAAGSVVGAVEQQGWFAVAAVGVLDEKHVDDGQEAVKQREARWQARQRQQLWAHQRVGCWRL